MMTGQPGFALLLADHGPKNFRRGESCAANRAEPRNFPGCGISPQLLTAPHAALY
jgi:hypothetical protein